MAIIRYYYSNSVLEAGIVLTTQADKQQNNAGAHKAHVHIKPTCVRLGAPAAFCCDSRNDSTQQRLKNRDEIPGSLLRR